MSHWCVLCTQQEYQHELHYAYLYICHSLFDNAEILNILAENGNGVNCIKDDIYSLG